jgi:ATP-dependent Clp protease adaptor protein ClpS
MSNTDIQLDEKIKTIVTEPKKWKVIFINDDTTPVDFVISLLMSIFKHDIDSATEVTMQVHESGSGVAGVYSFEIAESKSVEASNTARINNFPLQIKIECDE